MLDDFLLLRFGGRQKKDRDKCPRLGRKPEHVAIPDKTRDPALATFRRVNKHDEFGFAPQGIRHREDFALVYAGYIVRQGDRATHQPRRLGGNPNPLAAGRRGSKET